MHDYELFEPGDWVTWRYEPGDEEGPYAYLKRQLDANGEMDPIKYELAHFDPPPYLVVRTLWVPREELSYSGHPQFVGVRMVPGAEKLAGGAPNPDHRHFSGKLFVRADPPEERC